MKFKQSLAVAFTVWQRHWFASPRTREREAISSSSQ